MNRKAVIAIICGGLVIAIMLGARQSMGMFLRPIAMDLDIGRQTFGFALALQNLVWGALSPFAGYVADRFGAVKVIGISTLIYAAGLGLATMARDPSGLNITLGVLIGIGLAGGTFVTVLGAVGRMVRPEVRTTALGITSAMGSLGMFTVVPGAQSLIDMIGWVSTMSVLAALTAAMSFFALGLRDEGAQSDVKSANTPDFAAGLHAAKFHLGYWLLFAGFFVCGFHVVFIAVHIPAYLADNGVPSHVGAAVLAIIGLFNVVGTYVAGRLGDIYRKKYLLSWLYLIRAIVITLFVLAPLTAVSAYIFAAAIGLLWLSTVPLTSGLIGQIFGVRHMSTLYGGVFFSHQIGSFLGAWFGGYMYDMTGNYDLVWLIAIALGVVAALLHMPITDAPVTKTADLKQ